MKKWFNKIKTNFKNATKGFSLVELIVVIAIMAVMAAVLAPALIGYVERSRAQKDDSAMGEVTNAIQLSLADQNVYDELLPYAVKGNFSCYADGDASTNTDDNKIITKSPDYWLFNDNARLLDEVAYQPAGSMRGVTITLKPNGSAEYILKDGIINQTGDSSTAKGTIAGKTLNDAPEVYNRLRSTVGDTIKVSSQTYRNSTYTIFISMGTTGGNQADKQDAIQVYGQYNGTNLPEVMTATGSASQDKGNAGSSGNGGGTPAIVEGSVTFSGYLTDCECDHPYAHSEDCYTGGVQVVMWSDLTSDENIAKYGLLFGSNNVLYFRHNQAVTDIVYPSTTTTIRSGEVEMLNNIKTVTIPTSVTTIESGAINYCGSLQTINYLGTKAQWDAIDFQTEYDEWGGVYPWMYASGGGTPITIVCTDETWTVPYVNP